MMDEKTKHHPYFYCVFRKTPVVIDFAFSARFVEQLTECCSRLDSNWNFILH